MATDDLVDDGTDAGGTDAAAATSPAPVSTADITAAVKAGLSEFGGEFRNMGAQISQAVSQSLASAQQATNSGTANEAQLNLTQQLLSDPETAIGGVVEKILRTTLGPYLQTKVQDDYESLLDGQRAKIDSEYGEGTFDELVLPDLEAVVQATENKAAKSSKQYISTVVRGIVGHEKVRPKLMEKHTQKLAKDKADNDGPNGILDGGRRKGAKPTLSPDDIEFIAGHERVSGNKLDRKLLEEAISVRKRDGGWTIDNFPGLKQ